MESERRQLRQVRQEGEEIMEEQSNILQKILFAAVVSLGITTGLMMMVFFLDLTLCGGNCLI